MSDHSGESQFEFGILFVNGFREQRPGSAIALFAATLYRWLCNWNTREAPSPALPPPVLSEVLLSGAGGDGDQPAHLTLSVPLRLSTGPQDAQWLLAESSWADLFSAPRFLGLARWIWKVSTCLLVLQFVTPMHRHWQASQDAKCPPRRRAADKAMTAVYLVFMGVGAMLSVLQAALLMAVALASYLPIPRIDSAVRWIVVHISAMLGDTYMLAHCPVQFAAMRTHVASDLAWLQERCKKVAVVAHSQGAALAHQVLRDGIYSRDGLQAFITLGQAISKFDLLRLLDWDPDARQKARRSRTLVTAGMCCAGLPAVLLLCHWANVAPSTVLTSLPWWPLLLGIGFASIALGVHQAVSAVSANVKKNFGLPDATYTWSDYYASADPVSNGPLAHCPAGARQRPSDRNGRLVPCPCHEVYNSGSIAFDHNGYLRNQDELLPSPLNDLVVAAYADETRPLERPELVRGCDVSDATERRQRLIRKLVAIRVVAILLFAGALWADPGRALKHQIGPFMHLVKAPPAMASDLATRPLLAVLITAVFYLGAVVAWQYAMRRSVRRFFSDARFPETRTRPDPGEPAGQPAMSGLSSGTA